FDKKPSKDGTPRWDVVDVAFEESFESIVSLSDMKGCEELATMPVVQKGSRHSVTPVEKAHFRRVLKLAGSKLRIR
ncbi:MAG: EVE domain-containing protein, partial [Myxococcota bacterium]